MYIILYIIMIGYIFLSNYYPHKNILMWSLFILFCIVFGFRYDVGIDYDSYHIIFNSNYGDLEKGYEILQTFSKKLNSFETLIFLTFFITNFFIVKTLREKNVQIKFVIYFYFVFMTSGLLFGFLNVIRQGLAASVFYYSFVELEKRKIIKAVFFIFLGTLFHKTLVLVVPFFIFIYFVNIKKITSIFILIGFYIFTILNLLERLLAIAFKITDFSYKGYNFYSLDKMILSTKETLGLGVMLKIIIFIIIITQNTISNKKLDHFEKIYMLALIFNIIGLKNYLVGRFGIYFDLFGVACIAKFLTQKANSKTYFCSKAIIIILLSIVYFKIVINPSEESKIRYKSIFYSEKNNNY